MARARVQYELDGTRQAVWIELRLLFGLWHRRWRVPEVRGRAKLTRSGRFLRRAQHTLVPGRDPTVPREHVGRSPTLRAIDYLRGRARVLQLRLEVRLGTGDAALTAVAVGAIHALLATGLALLPAYFHTDRLVPEVQVRPDYAAERLEARGDCILVTRFGHLMVAVALAWWTDQLPRMRSDRRSQVAPTSGV